jgi:hypothetical protein
MSVGKVLLVGTISNASSVLEGELNRVLEALSFFDDVEIFLVESDSTDSTVEKLQYLAGINQKFSFMSLGALTPVLPNRIERLRHCRNVYVEHIRDRYSNESLDYVVAADLDGMNPKISKDGVSSCFNNKISWDACFSNQLAGYSDIYALRSKGWQDKDCFVELSEKNSEYINSLGSNMIFRNVRIAFNNNKIRQSVIYSKMRKIPKNAPWVKVESAFGGLGIYKAEIFFLYNYDKRDVSDVLVSEHVDLHSKLIDSNLYINPALINANWNTYNLNKFQLIRYIRVLIRKSSKLRETLKTFVVWKNHK